MAGNWTLDDPLTEDQWQAIEDAALRILEKTGMLAPHGEAQAALAGKPGIRLDGEIVRLDPQLVREHGRSVRGTTTYDTRIITGAYCHHYMDPDSGQVRPPTVDDLVTSVRQAEALGGGVCAPVVPLDVPGYRQELIMERVTHENSRFSYGGGQATSAVTAEAQIEMSTVVNRPHELELWVNSPLNMDPTGLDILWQLRHRRPRVRIANMPVLGMSAPISIAGLLAQTTAECLGAAALLRILNITDSISFRVDAFWGYAVDMRSANVLLSGPDYLRLMLLSNFLGKRYGIAAPMGKALMTASKLPDAQAGAEKAAQALAAAQAGAGTFTAVGTLSLVEIFSPLQMVIDHEIMRWVDSFMRPVDFSEEDFLLDVIDDVGAGGTFLDQPTTAIRCREALWWPGLFTTNAYPSWVGEGKPTVLDKARDLLTALDLADGSLVSSEQQRELARIEEKFTAQLVDGG